jgi:hypothetical protein
VARAGLRTGTTPSSPPRPRDYPRHKRDDASGPGRETGTPGTAPRGDRNGAGTTRPAAGQDPGPYRDRPAPVPEGADDRDGPGLVLVPFVDRDGTRYVTERELSRLHGLLDREATAADVLASGEPGDELPIAAAARLAGASPSYLARLCRTYESHGSEITSALAAGEIPKAGVPSVPAHRGRQLPRQPRRAGRVR